MLIPIFTNYTADLLIHGSTLIIIQLGALQVFCRKHTNYIISTCVAYFTDSNYYQTASIVCGKILEWCEFSEL